MQQPLRGQRIECHAGVACGNPAVANAGRQSGTVRCSEAALVSDELRSPMAIGKLTPAMLNAMPVEDRVKALNELFPKMEAWAAHHIACFRWNRRPRLF